jgi:hypothetical protein
MSDISLYFSSLEPNESAYNEDQIGDVIIANIGEFPDLESDAIALIYVPEFRGSATQEKNQFSSNFRDPFYQLYKGKKWTKKHLRFG